MSSANLCFITKFSPIQDDVSISAFFAAHDLAQAGHIVHVLTHTPDDEAQKLSLPLNVHVHRTQEVSSGYYSPWVQLSESRLFGLALRVVEQYQCDCVIGCYLQPYGVVAAQVACALGKPLGLIHAGSDLFRLSKHKDLASAYAFALKQADVIFTYRNQAVRQRLIELGANPERFISMHRSRLSKEFNQARQGLRPLLGHSTIVESSANEVPTLLHYSKIGETKGSFDLLAALAMLAREGVNFRFECILLGKSSEISRLREYLQRTPELLSRTSLRSPVPYSQVPALLYRTHVSVALDRELDIEAYGTKLPREILASQKCLIISSELADKQPFRASLIHRKNCLIVNPKDHHSFSAMLRDALTNSSLRSYIANHGALLSQFYESLLPEQNSYAAAILRSSLLSGQSVYIDT
jgi:glycosyltransferase involved in cell wall biosynthesis